MLYRIAGSAIALMSLGGCVTPEIVNWRDAGSGVSFYGERLDNAGTYYFMETPTDQPRCAAWQNYEGQAPAWFRLAPGEKRTIGRGVTVIATTVSTDLRRC